MLIILSFWWCPGALPYYIHILKNLSLIFIVWSTLSSSSGSVFQMIHSVGEALPWVFNLVYWIFISSIISVWLFVSFSFCWILFSFFINFLIHLYLFSLAVYSYLLWAYLTSLSGCSSRSFSLGFNIIHLYFLEEMCCLGFLCCFVSALELAHLDILAEWKGGSEAESGAVYLLVLGVSRCWKSQGLGTLLCWEQSGRQMFRSVSQGLKTPIC